MNIPSPWLLAAIFLASSIVSGCADTTTPQANPTISNPEKDADAVNTDNSASKSKTEVQLPAAAEEDLTNSIPKDIYIAEEYLSSQMAEIAGKQNVILEYEVDDIESFIESFHDGMKEQGWVLVTSSKLPIGTLANFSKDDRKCTVSISPPKDQIVKVAILLPQ
ncbi:MAG: hypothetical protein AAGG44_06925 [Planctomycetota bacterium]